MVANQGTTSGRSHWRKFLLRLVLALPFLFLDTSFANDETPKFRIGYQSSPPYQIIDENGEIGGIAIELIEESAERLGIELEWIHCPKSPDFHFANGDIDLWPVATDLPHRRDDFYITKPFYQNSLGILSRQETPILTPSQSSGQTIAYYDREPSLTLVPKLLPDAVQVPVANHVEAIKSVLSGESDGAFLWSTKSNSINFKRVIDEHPEVSTYFYTFPNEKLNCGIAAALENPDAIEAADRIREEFRKLVKEGFVQAVYFKYYLDPENEISSYFYLEEVKGKARTLTIGIVVLVFLVLTLAVMAFLLQRSRRKAQAANEAKNLFLANMSHEFRTPLNGIMGMTQLAIRSPDDQEKPELLETVLDSAEAMLTLVNDILDISKIESGRFSVEKENVELDDMLRTSSNFFSILAKQKGLDFTCKQSPSCPSVFVSDAARLRQILFNLIGNAIKFTREGKVSVSADRIQLEKKDYLLLEVSDTGVGIEDDLQEEIFQSFTQADHSTTREFGGTGLGLSISRQLARLLGGEVYVESIPGKGSVFSVTIPLKTPNGIESKSPTLETDFESLQSLSILVVDDNVINLRTVEAILKRMNHKATCVSNGQDALEAYRNQDFDLVLMDLQMPGLDGWETARILRSETHAKGGMPPLIALTASTYSSNLNRRVRQEMDGLVLKPIVISSLQAEIHRALNRQCEEGQDSAVLS